MIYVSIFMVTHYSSNWTIKKKIKRFSSQFKKEDDSLNVLLNILPVNPTFIWRN